MSQENQTKYVMEFMHEDTGFCRVVYRYKKHLYCIQEERKGFYVIYSCTKDEEPQSEIKPKEGVKFEPSDIPEYDAFLESKGLLHDGDSVHSYHYYRLNNYRDTIEYYNFAKSVGMSLPEEKPTRELIGDKWKINKDLYDGALHIPEYTFEDITTKFSKKGNEYFCEFIRFSSDE